MFNYKCKNHKGISLTLITGLVSLLMITSAAISELIIANMRSVQRIEASNKSYYLAEAGLEDALYELSPRFPGYETPSFDLPNGSDNPEVRSTQLDGTSWKNEWQIESRSKQKEWGDNFYKNEKLMIFLFNDTNNEDGSGNPKPIKNNEGIITNAINQTDEVKADIKTLDVHSNFSITFTIPSGVIESGKLKIDNDGDLGTIATSSGLNEDPPDLSTPGVCPSNPEDNDCDGLVDEDSVFDPVILWKLTDGESRSLIPLKGCLTQSLPGTEKSELCEDDFGPSETLTQNAWGLNQDGGKQTIKDFILDTYNGSSGIQPTLPKPTQPVTANKNSQLHFEFLIVAPMTHIQLGGTIKKKDIPYIEYKVKSDPMSGGSDKIPNPYFTIKSDGFYRDFKQSITATLTPKTTVPLLDFTIIQQQ